VLETSELNAMINATRFESNSGSTGGALLIQCSYNCSYEIVDSVFERNYAEEGGAIYFKSMAPWLTNTSFVGNTAVMGPDFGSEPIAVRF
jgi:hypothetical protein